MGGIVVFGTADHDMIYLEPFKGAKEVRKYFDKVTSIVPGDLKFCVEDITDGDPRKVGVKWCGSMVASCRQLQEIACGCRRAFVESALLSVVS